MNDSTSAVAEKTLLMPGAVEFVEPALVLASASPRRQQLLREAGYVFELDPANIDEDSLSPRLLPVEVARILAGAKADTVATRRAQQFILAADTVVAFGDTPLSKPEDAEDARRMLTLLSGTTHIVITGVVLMRRRPEFRRSVTVMSAVRMRNLSLAEIESYVASGLWEGKAGGYGIQDNDPFVTRMSGSHTNIVGLPMKETVELLDEAGIVPKAATG